MSFRHVGLSVLDDVLPRFALVIEHAKSREEYFRSFFLDFRVWIYMDPAVQVIFFFSLFHFFFFHLYSCLGFFNKKILSFLGSV